MADVKDIAEEQAGDKSAASAAAPVAGAGAPAGADGVKAAVRQVRSRGARAVPFGIAHVRATFNNTIICITDAKGGVIAWSTSGRAGFKGSRKSTAFAASVVAQEAARQAVSKGMQEVEVRVQGPGAGRESAIRALQASGLNLTVIKDITPMPHNGCRPRKRRRV
jgi:small subunit ribosomal protein S11